MDKKVKRFILMVLFSFFYSLLSGKSASAASARVCLVPRSGDDLKYNGQVVSGISAETIAKELCY